MTRSLTAAFKAAAASSTCRPVLLFEGAFGGTPFYWNNTGRDLSWNGHTWLANGFLQSFSGGGEKDDLARDKLTIKLGAAAQSLIAVILQTARKNDPGTLYFGFLDAAGAIVSDPYPYFLGRYEVSTIDNSIDEPTIQLSYVSDLPDLNRAKDYRYNKETQRLFDPTDLGFNYVPHACDCDNLTWGPTKTTLKNHSDTRKGKNNKRGKGENRRVLPL